MSDYGALGIAARYIRGMGTPPLPRRNLYLAWLAIAAIVAIVGIVELATHGDSGAGYLGAAAVIALVVRDRIRRQLRRQLYGPTRVELAADRLHRWIVGR